MYRFDYSLYEMGRDRVEEILRAVRYGELLRALEPERQAREQARRERARSADRAVARTCPCCARCQTVCAA